MNQALSQLMPRGQYDRFSAQFGRNENSFSLALSQTLDRLVSTEGVIPGSPPWVEVSALYADAPHKWVVGIHTAREKGSGVLIDGGRYCLTAAHVVRREARPNGSLSQLQVYLGPIGGRRPLAVSGTPIIPADWSGVAGDHLDVALIPLGVTTSSSAEYADLPDNAWSGLANACSIMAYARPGALRNPALRVDGPEALAAPNEETLWAAPIREITPVPRDRRLVGHWSITVGGWSGAPVFAQVRGAWSVIAVHVSDDAQTPEKWLNCAVRMTAEAKHFLDLTLGRV